MQIRTIFYFLEMLLLIPTSAVAVMPLHCYCYYNDYSEYPSVINKDRNLHETNHKTGNKEPVKIYSIAAVLLAVLMTAGAFIGSRLEIHPKYMFLLAYIIISLYFFFNIRTDTLIKLFSFSNAAMLACFDILYINVYVASFEVGVSRGLSFVLAAAGHLIFMVLLIGVLFNTLTIKFPYLFGAENLREVWGFAFIIPLFLVIVFFWSIPKSAAVVMTGRVQATSLAYLTIIILIITVFYHFLWLITKQLTEHAIIREENEFLKMEGKRYAELRAYMDETKALRHDFRQHMLVIANLARNGKTEQLFDYVSGLTDNVSDKHAPFCRNGTVDTVVAHYDRMAKEQKINIQWMLAIPEELPVKESDFCAVFGNLLENALLAVSKLSAEERKIHVTARMLSDAMLGLTVKNPYTGEIVFDKNGLPVTQQKGDNHGIGLSSVAAIAHKYNGALDIKASDGWFNAGVLLYTG